MSPESTCWRFFRCPEKGCPAHGNDQEKCWLIAGTLCREDLQGVFLEKIEACLECNFFRQNMSPAAMEETLRVVHNQFQEYARAVAARDKELEDISTELALGLSEVFIALKKLSAGDPTVRLPEQSELELIRKLKQMVNQTAENLGEIVDLSHEFAVGLAEHFDVLHRVSRGDLNARVTGHSRVDLLEMLKSMTNQTIQSVSQEINHRRQVEEALRAGEASLTRAQKMAHLGNWELDLATMEFDGSEEVFAIYGIERPEGKIHFDQFALSVHRDDLPLVQKVLDDAPNLDQPVDLEHRIIRPDHQVRIVHQLAEVMHGPNGSPGKLVGAIQDITERRESEEKMRLLARVFENTIEGILVTDVGGVIEMVNPAFSMITGYQESEAIGQNPRLLSSGRQEPEFYKTMWDSLRQTGQWRGEIWNRRKSGEAYPQWMTITAIKNPRGVTTHYVGVFHDITEIKASEEQITFQAYHDALTGLPNRVLFNDRLTVAIAHAHRKNQGLAVLFMDLDHFKNINDSLGHEVGDLLLQAVAGRLVRWVREEDTVARLGGDEFIMLLQGAEDPDYAMHVAHRILGSLAEPFWIKNQELYITASVGITIYPHDGEDLETLVANADIAMYRAKEDGRNNCKLFTPAMNEEVMRRMALENSLRKAIERQEFRVLYQPKLDMSDGRVVGVEALLRWQRPGEGLVLPEKFLTLAEETGLIIPIGEWVLKTACRQVKQWHQEGFGDLLVAVNLSPRQFHHKSLIPTVQDILEQNSLSARYLELEINESVVIFNLEQAVEILRGLGQLGVRLSLDDFGRGYSSLYFLKSFPMDSLKIDRTFIQEITRDTEDASIVNTIISMSRSLNLQVIAEGVETQEQLEFLKRHHCDQVQGFLFSQPVPASQVSDLLHSGKVLS